MRIVALAGLVVVLAACGSAPEGTSGPPGTPSVGATTAPPATSALPALDSPAPTWRFPHRTAPDVGMVEALSAALGGSPYVATDAPQSWTFSPPAPAIPGGGGATSEEIAAGVWKVIGVDPTTLHVSVSPDGRTVTGVEQLGGVASPLPFVVTVDGAARIVSASGHLAPTEPAGDQPRIGIAAAIALLTAAPAGDNRGETQPSLRPDPAPAVPPLSPDPTTEPTVVDRMLRPVTAVTETYLVTPASDGGALLLPAYRFTFDDGATQIVAAVTASSPEPGWGNALR
jgi:hypothetical protein